MKILPSWREKRRYLFIKSEYGVKNWHKIRDNFVRFGGMLQAAKAGAMLINSISTPQKYFIVSINRNYVDLFRASLTLDDAHCVYVSGTLKKVKKNLNPWKDLKIKQNKKNYGKIKKRKTNKNKKAK